MLVKDKTNPRGTAYSRLAYIRVIRGFFMFFNEFLHATQYYRSPTPLENEWESDLVRMSDYDLDTIQIRINWRWNERIEGKYDFSDVDKLLNLAEKHRKKVIIKFLLECAPQYVYDKYGGTRIAHDGTKLSPGSHGAFYGGYRPCFTNPYVLDRAVKFVEKVAERYSSNKNIIFWNAWNEIRNTPEEECFCPHCRKAFGKYLENKYGTIEKLNEFYGAAEESFENIEMPSMARGHWDIFEFKKFKGGYELNRWLKSVYDGIRKYDDRPIMTHVGCPSVYQDAIEDTCEDSLTKKAVDFYGTSVCIDSLMDTKERRLDYLMLNDFMRSVDENYLVYEIYPGLGMFREYDTRFDMKFKQYAAAACGAKGINYWQWRAERVGHEADCAGIVRMNGKPREVALEVKSFAETLKKDGELFVRSETKKSGAAILFDYDSGLMSAIEDHCVENSFKRNPDARGYYHGAVKGMYRLLAELGVNCDFVQTTDLGGLSDSKFLYVPYYTMIKKEVAEALEKFVKGGGIVVADEGFGMRQPNTWMQPYDIDCKPLLNVVLDERRICKGAESVDYNGKTAQIYPFKTTYDVSGEETAVMNFGDGEIAVRKISYGKGEFYLCGFSIGYSYLKTGDELWKNFVSEKIKAAGVEKTTFGDGNEVYEKRLTDGDKEIIFLLNCSDKEKRFEINGEIVSFGGDGKIDGSALTVCGKGAGYAIIKRQ